MPPTSDEGALCAALLRITGDAFIVIDREGIITGWNEGAERLFGYEAAQAIGQSIRMIIPHARYEEDNEARRRVLDGEVVRDLETLRWRRDGGLLRVSLTMAPIQTPGGDIVGALRLSRDVTGRETAVRASRRLAAIVESSEDAIISKDLNAIVTSWNLAAERMFGYTSDEMIGQSIRTIIPADHQSEEDDVLARLRRGESVKHFETVRRRKDGSLVPVSLSISPIRAENGVVVGASKIARDVTERRQHEAERTRLLWMAQEASRLKDEFLATLSHELRTPLNAILGYARMLRSGIIGGDKRTRAIEVIERNATSLNQIVEDVLDVSRIISGKMRLNVQPVDLTEVVRAALDVVMPAADAKGIQIDPPLEGVAAPISGDSERLRQVVWNLLSNAVKFTNRGGTVRVRIAPRESFVELIVTDTGIGISSEFLPFVFDRFRQADSKMTREQGGLGLGLGIARQLVEMHGGTIRAASDGTGTGATFTVSLPMTEAQASQRAPQPEARRGVREGPRVAIPDLHGVRVLAVDDDRDALGMVREILEATGAQVSVANSGPAALEALPSARPDVIIADIGMPRMDGFELITLVRENADPAVRGVPAAALTAYARSEDRARALRSGFQMHLAKPIDPSELMFAVASLAGRVDASGSD